MPTAFQPRYGILGNKNENIILIGLGPIPPSCPRRRASSHLLTIQILKLPLICMRDYSNTVSAVRCLYAIIQRVVSDCPHSISSCQIRNTKHLINSFFYEFIAVDFYREFIYWKVLGSPGFWSPAVVGLYLVSRWKITIATTMDYVSCAKKYYPTCFG